MKLRSIQMIWKEIQHEERGNLAAKRYEEEAKISTRTCDKEAKWNPEKQTAKTEINDEIWLRSARKSSRQFFDRMHLSLLRKNYKMKTYDTTQTANGLPCFCINAFCSFGNSKLHPKFDKMHPFSNRIESNRERIKPNFINWVIINSTFFASFRFIFI